MKDELYVDGVKMDMGDETVSLSYKSGIFSDIDKIVGNGSYTISLPKTKHNLAAFEAAHMVSGTTDYPYKLHGASLIRDGVEIVKKASLIILSIKDKIETQLTFGIDKAIESLKDKSLQDLPPSPSYWNAWVFRDLRTDEYIDSYAVDLGQNIENDGRGCWTLTLKDIIDRIRQDSKINIDIPSDIEEKMGYYEVPLIAYRPLKEWYDENKAVFFKNGASLQENLFGFGTMNGWPDDNIYDRKVLIIGQSNDARFDEYQYGTFLSGGYATYENMYVPSHTDAYIMTRYHDLKLKIKFKVSIAIQYNLIIEHNQQSWVIDEFKYGGKYKSLNFYPVVSELEKLSDNSPTAYILINGHKYSATDSYMKDPLTVYEVKRERISYKQTEARDVEHWVIYYDGEVSLDEYSLAASLFDDGETARIMRFISIASGRSEFPYGTVTPYALYGISPVTVEITPGLKEISPTWYRPNENDYDIHICGGTFYDTVNLPDKTQLDFIKSVSKIFGLFTVKTDKGLRFNPYKTLEDNKKIAYDWSENVISSKYYEPEEKGSIDFKGRLLWFRYDSNDNVDATQTDYYVDTGNFTAEENETDYVKLIFSGCDNKGYRGVARIPILKRNTSSDQNTPFDKWNFNSDSKCYLLETTEYGEKKIFNTAWSKLLKENWGVWEKMAKNSVLIKHLFKLPPIVLRDLDMSRPVYLRQYGAYFVIDEITTKENNISEVKLVKMK